MANRNSKRSKPTKSKKGVGSKKMSTPKGFSIPLKEILILLCYLLIPSLLVSLTTREFHFNRIWLVSIYVITLIGIVAFYFFKFYLSKFKTLALLLGLALSPLYTYIYEARWAAQFARMDDYLEEGFPTISYIFTPLSIFFYALPFFVVSAIGLVVLFTVRSRRNLTI